jgi:hypothetical protein
MEADRVVAAGILLQALRQVAQAETAVFRLAEVVAVERKQQLMSEYPVALAVAEVMV